MKKAIVTGANGFLGKYLVQELVENEYCVWAVVRDKEKNIDNFEGNPKIHIVYCDLNNISNLSSFIEADSFDCFYHLAWSGSSGIAREDYKLQLHNAESCVDAALIASFLKCRRFIGIGSVTELMCREYLHQDGSKPEMATCYAIGKMAAEYMTRCVCTKQNIEFIWTYLSNFYGIGDNSQNFVNMLIKSYLHNETPDLTLGNQMADFMYVSDVAKALTIIGKKGIANNTYYVGYGEPRPLKCFVKSIHALVNPVIETGLGKKIFQGLEIDFDLIDIKKIQRDMNFIPNIPFEIGIEKTIKWIKEFII
jgi:nucleoside-diphosphate-sugar epimerase